MNQRFVKTVLVGALAIAMVGCGTKSIKADPRKPAKLVKLDSQAAVLTPVFSAKLEQGKADNRRDRPKRRDIIDLQVAPTANGLIAAARGGAVTAFNGSSALWTTNLGEAISSGTAVNAAGNVAVVGTRSGNVVALNTANGETLWTATLPSASLAPALILGNRVIVSTNQGMVYGLDLASGAQVWQYSAQMPAISVRGMATPLALDARTVLIGGADGRIHALDAGSGAPVWARRIGVAMGAGDMAKLRDVDGTPVVVGNYLYATSFSGQLAGFDMSTGQQLFSSELATSNAATVLGDLVIGTSRDGDVVAFNRMSGEQVWSNDELKFRGLTNPAAVGEYIAVGDAQGYLHLFDKSGKIVSRIDGKRAFTSLQVKGNRLYTQNVDGVVSVWQF